ncbi:MAG: hypothetical protein QOI63_1688 [Thermoplasmata archaeon]|jgi:hypothetical protein|nr:hypothetical protein [Thermoplasmata archaeon]
MKNALGSGDAAPLEIRDVEALARFRKAPRASRAPLVVALPGMTAEEQAAAGARLAAQRGACGCAAGAVTLTAAVVGAAAWSVGHFHTLSGLALQGLPITLAAGLAGAGLGKLAGLAWSRHRLRAEVDRLIASQEAA